MIFYSTRKNTFPLSTHNCLCVLFELLVVVVSVCLPQQVCQETLKTQKINGVNVQNSRCVCLHMTVRLFNRSTAQCTCTGLE